MQTYIIAVFDLKDPNVAWRADASRGKAREGINAAAFQSAVSSLTSIRVVRFARPTVTAVPTLNPVRFDPIAEDHVFLRRVRVITRGESRLMVPKVSTVPMVLLG